MSKTNAELFAQAVSEALTPQEKPTTEPDERTGPRKPEPVPEVGSHGAPGQKEAQKMYDFEQSFISAFNRNR
jgi:hypothetical protein